VSNSGIDTVRLFKGRFGVCHRCGWSGLVGKVGRRDSGRITSGAANGRLCHECATDLVGPALWDILENARFEGDGIGASPERVLANRGA
jgi:hypothetical protein